MKNGGNVFVNMAECFRSHIAILGRNLAWKYDGGHVKATKKGQSSTLHTYNNFGQV